MRTNVLIFTIVLGALFGRVQAAELAEAFRNPADAARPGVYWYFLDGNQDRDAMMADLRAMKDVGIGSFIFLEVDLGVPRGPVPFMSEQWQENVADAFVEAGDLGLEVILGTGPGWSGSGGSWVPVEDSMKHLVGSRVQVGGPGVLKQVLPVPPPHSANPFAGMSNSHAAQRNAWFEDVAVIAFPTPPEGAASIEPFAIKTLKDIAPYSIRRTRQRFVMPQAAYPEPGEGKVIDPARVIDITSLLQPDGSIHWTIPDGDWTVMRFVARSTGQTTRPAPRTGHGFENDKFDAATYRRHWDNYQQILLDKVIAKGGPLEPGKGLTTIHLDSWEMSSQNWTDDFRKEFRNRRGYDPQPFYPAWMGMVVGSREKTERFLWDMRKTSQELVLAEYAGEIKRLAHEHGLRYSNEPYDMNPAGDIDLGSVADIPMCEFWNDSHDTQYGCIEAVSIAHTMGPQIVRAESFTGRPPFNKNPANMKNQTDWALALGINGFFFHTFQHQPLGPEAKPGMTFGPYGIHWNRNQTFWEMLPGYHRYLTRSSDLLRQGEAVADILYLIPEGAPHIFEPPSDALQGAASMRDKKGYSFDAVSPRILQMRAEVKDGRIAFPGGTSYRLLVLPRVDTMTPELLGTLTKLVEAGATIVGDPPTASPSLVGYPECDAEVQRLAKALWQQDRVIPDRMDRSRTVESRPPLLPRAASRGPQAAPRSSGLHQNYAKTAAVLASLGVPEDFRSDAPMRYIHRRTKSEDIYFIANTQNKPVETTCTFRVAGGAPQLWDPVTGEMRSLPQFTRAGETTSVPMRFAPHQSFFVIFPDAAADQTPAQAPAVNFSVARPVLQLDGAWDVAFDPARGAPGRVTFDALVDWTRRPEEGIRYYSGKGTYHKTFDVPGFDPAEDQKIFLDLGTVHSICRVRLNGRDLGTVWTAPWRVDVTPVLQAEDNRLVVEVINNWANRLIGDRQPDNKDVRTLSWPAGLLGGRSYKAGRYTYVWHNYHKAGSPLLPSGLLGPVSVMMSRPDLRLTPGRGGSE